jgi:hypothetical protein
MQPTWLSDFQKQFSAALREPLAIETGTLRPVASPWAVYNQQYWFRLLTVMQDEYPLLARLLGLWSFNQLVQRYLLQHPPQHDDVRAITVAFPKYLQDLPMDLHLIEAAQLDRIRQVVFMAPYESAWKLSPEEAQGFSRLQLHAAQNWSIFSEHWPLVSLSLHLDSRHGGGPLPLPAAHDQPRHWLIQRSTDGIDFLALEPLQAKLYEQVSLHPIGEALGLLDDLLW